MGTVWCLFRKHARDLTRSGVTKAAVGVSAAIGLYLGVRWNGVGLFDDVFAMSFFLLAATLVPSAMISAETWPRNRDSRMLVLHATLPVGLARQVYLAQAIALATSLGLVAALTASLWLFAGPPGTVALAIGSTLIPVVLLGWGIGSIVASFDTSRIQALLLTVGLSLAILLTTRYMLGFVLDRLGLGILAKLNPLQPVQETLIHAVSGWGGSIAIVPALLGMGLAALSVPLARRTGVPR